MKFSCIKIDIIRLCAFNDCQSSAYCCSSHCSSVFEFWRGVDLVIGLWAHVYVITFKVQQWVIPACCSLAAFLFTSSWERPSVMVTTTFATFLLIPLSRVKTFSYTCFRAMPGMIKERKHQQYSCLISLTNISLSIIQSQQILHSKLGQDLLNIKENVQMYLSRNVQVKNISVMYMYIIIIKIIK